jgi:3',5'-cyclic AMP phosphodiesterase CpdA
VSPRLLAISDLHVGHPKNRALLDEMPAGGPGDWLIVAGDVAENFADVEWGLGVLAGRFDQVVWVPGNHELWARRADPVTARGAERYALLVEMCRRLGVLTPEDAYPVWTGPDGPVTVAPLFVGYDYSFLPAGAVTKEDGLAIASQAGVMCTDEYHLHPDPYSSREAWCRDRAALTEARLAADLDPAVPAVLVNHYPLVREPTRIMRYPEFAQWCGTVATADWHTRFNVAAVVYGHLHIPRVTWHDGVRFEEVSVGYPREWELRAARFGVTRNAGLPRQVLPEVVVANGPPGVPEGLRM